MLELSKELKRRGKADKIGGSRYYVMKKRRPRLSIWRLTVIAATIG